MYYLDSAGPHQDFCLAHFYNLLHQINYVCMYVCMLRFLALYNQISIPRRGHISSKSNCQKH